MQIVQIWSTYTLSDMLRRRPATHGTSTNVIRRSTDVAFWTKFELSTNERVALLDGIPLVAVFRLIV